MKNYMVAHLSFFDNDMVLIQVKAESEYEAVKASMVQISSPDIRQEEIDFQNSEEYPKDYESQKEYYFNADLVVGAKEIEN